MKTDLEGRSIFVTPVSSAVARLTLPDDRFILSGMTTLYEAIPACIEQLLGLCDALAVKLQAAQVEREKLVEAVVAGVSDPHPASP